MAVHSLSMNDTNVPSNPPTSPERILDLLSIQLPILTPELNKAATYVLDNPNEIGVSTVREIAQAASVKPNTLVRMARSIGFEGFEDFRLPFRNEIRQGRDSFPDRARWLQSLSKGGKLPKLYANLAADSIGNIESLFANTDVDALKHAANDILEARATFVMGVGIANALAQNFAYLANMAVDNISAVPRDGSLPVDGIINAKPDDILIAMTFKPYRREIVEAVELADSLGMTIIAISDSLASPIMSSAKHRFVIPMETPQFFTSTVALSAFLETLMAFIIADADSKAINHIAQFHQRRQQLGIYIREQE